VTVETTAIRMNSVILPTCKHFLQARASDMQYISSWSIEDREKT
jgi:hypothetical protein